MKHERPGNPKFETGNVVAFNSGGPEMTVTSIHYTDTDRKERTGEISCGYFRPGEDYVVSPFDSRTVRLVEPKEKA